MDALTSILAFYATTLVFALAGYPLSRALGWRVCQSGMAARLVGMVAVTYPAWVTGLLGFRAWQSVGLLFLFAGALAGIWTLWRQRPVWRDLAGGELVFLLGSGLVLLLRLRHPEILGGEKPMDFGIVAGLLRTPGFPPPDLWLAGESLPYYYWGSLLWVLPVKASGVPLSEAYNLSVAALGGITLSLAWSLGARLSGSQSGGAIVAFLVVFAGTPDGLRQLLVKRSLGDVSLWESSRQDSTVITEFPLFSFWLGDLHPHLLSMPLTLLALSLSLSYRHRQPRLAPFLALCVVLGVVGMANPWAFPPTLAASALLLVVGDGKWRCPWGEGKGRWLSGLALGGGSLVAGAPFYLLYRPPVRGLEFVNAHTATPDLLWYGGVLILPLAGAAFAIVRARFADSERGLLMALLGFAIAFFVAAATERPTLVLLGLFGIAMLLATTGGRRSADRPALALALTGTMLFAVPEVIYVVDAYGERLHRMNTVFKAYHQGWVLLSLAWPVLIRRWLGGGVQRRKMALAGLAMLTLPHLGASLWGLSSGRLGLDGLRWMSPGDRAVVAFLSVQPPGTAIVEAVGEPYSQYARISAASGVPTYLGWVNHELVWRGPGAHEQLQSRERVVEDIYTSGKPNVIRRRIGDARIDYVVVGALERARYPHDGLARLIDTGKVVLEEGGTTLLSFDEDE